MQFRSLRETTPDAGDPTVITSNGSALFSFFDFQKSQRMNSKYFGDSRNGKAAFNVS